MQQRCRHEHRGKHVIRRRRAHPRQVDATAPACLTEFVDNTLADAHSGDTMPTAAIVAHIQRYVCANILKGDGDWLPVTAGPGEWNSTATDLIARARYRYEWGSSDDLHRQLADTLEATRAEAITLAIKLHTLSMTLNSSVTPQATKLQRFRVLATDWSWPENPRDRQLAAEDVLSILNELTPDGTQPSIAAVGQQPA